MKRRVALAAAVVVLIGAGVTAVVATSSSGPVRLEPAGTTFTPQGLLACTSATWCVTEGPGRGNGPPPQFWSWNGRAWRPMAESATFADDTTLYLNALACTSATQCVAVGYHMVNCLGSCQFVESTVTVQWNGRAWSQSPPGRGPHGASAELDGLSCPAHDDCYAVGATTEGALVEHWNGDDWDVMPNPLAHMAPFTLKTWGLGGSALSSVSCSSASDCMAVGRFSELTPGIRTRLVTEGAFRPGVPLAPSRTTAVVERYDGTAWTVSLVPYLAVPPGPLESPTPGVGFDDVTCASATMCLASGSVPNSREPEKVFDRWDGTRWSAFHWPGSGLDGVEPLVSCPAPTWCVALYQPSFSSPAEYPDVGASTAVVDVDAWTGARWAVTGGFDVKDTIPYGTDGIYRALNRGPETLTCSSSRFCLVAGDVGQKLPCASSESYVARWTGTTWAVTITGRSIVRGECK